MKNKCVVVVATILVVLVCTSVPAQSGNGPTQYVSVGWWDVPREKWAAFQQLYEKYELPVMDRLLGEGVLTEYGLDASGLHSPDGYTHSTWVVATSLGNLEQAMEAYYETLGDNASRVEAEMAGMITKHMDLTFQSYFSGSRPAKLTKGYFNSSSVNVKRGKGADFRKMWETRAKPVYDKLLADGIIVSYGLDGPYHHTSADSLGRHSTWYVLENMDNDAKVDAAFEASRANMTETERKAMGEYYWSLVVEDSHRDDFTRLIHYRTK